MLNAIESYADELNILYEHIEIKETGSFIRDVSISSKKFISSMSKLASLKSHMSKLIGVFKSFKAIVNPAQKIGLTYSKEAVDKILSVTKGYPYFIQALCNTIWNTQNGKTINVENVTNSIALYNQELDESFFMVRYDRCTPKEKEFMMAMVLCDELPCTIINVATIMKRSVKSISPTRGQLIDKGLIYATGHAEIDFTVPQFDKFIKRINPTIFDDITIIN